MYVHVCAHRSASNSGLSGVLPVSISALTQLAVLDISNNRHIGTIPALPGSLIAVALHSNSFGGKLDAIVNLTHLCALTVFDNHFSGRLVLPNMACPPYNPKPYGAYSFVLLADSPSPLLYAQNNLFSCSVKGNTSHFSANNLLLAPGNQLSLPPDQADFQSSMSSASFMWVSDTIDRHHWMFVYLIPGVLGLILLVSLISALVYAGWKNPLMISATAQTNVEKCMIATFKLHVPLGVLALVLGCWFGVAEHLYACGDPVLKMTVAYLTERELTNLATAAAAVLFSAANLYVVHGFRMKAAALYEVQGEGHTKSSRCLQICRKGHGQDQSPACQASLIIYCLVVAMCSLVPMLSTAVEYIPELGSTTGPIKHIYPLVAAIKYSAGFLLHMISSLLIPYCARRLAGSSAVAWMIFARLVINQFSAAVITLWLDQNCMSGWLRLFFNQCDSRTAFTASGVVTYDRGYNDYKNITVGITTHDEICATQMGNPGRCMQAAVENLSKLLVSKLIITAFVAPLVYLLRCLPCLRIAQGRFFRRLIQCCPSLICCLKNVSPFVRLDVEVISLIMLLEMSIVYDLNAQ